MLCKLCQQDRELKDSHVLPEFVYAAAYDAKHRALAPDKDQAKVPFVQKGWRERLLCHDCEQHIGRLERSFSQTWYHKGLIPVKAPPNVLDIQGLQYSEFKLFHLSVLWRAGVASTRPFNQVRLGPYEDPLRQLLLHLNAPPSSRYSVFAFALRDPHTGKIEQAIVMPPSSGRVKGVRCYSAIFGGCAWYYFVAQATPPLPHSLMLSEAGTLRMPVIDYTDHKPVTAFYKALRQSSRQWPGPG